MEYFRVINAVASNTMTPADAGKELQLFITNNYKK